MRTMARPDRGRNGDPDRVSPGPVWLPWLGGLAGLVFVGFVGYLAVKLGPDWFAAETTCTSGDATTQRNCLDAAKAEADDRRGVTTAILAVIALALSVFGAIYTARGFRQNRDATDRRHKLDRDAHKLNREAADHRHRIELEAHALDQARQITERFTRAIDQIGSDKLDVRLGGIYALERVARDSKADHPQVVEVLTAYVREHAPWPPRPVDPAGTSGARRAPARRGDQREPDLPTDVQAAITVLGRRDISQDRTSDQIRLSDVDLRRVSMREGHFERARLRGSHLEEAHLEGAHLQGAKLRDAHFERADLGPDSELGLPGANLEGALIKGANFSGAKLRGARFTGAERDEATKWPADFNADAAVGSPGADQPT